MPMHMQAAEPLATELHPYTLLIDENTTPDRVYFGKSHASAEDQPIWQIKCIDDSTDTVRFLYADGEKTFTKIWNKRAEYSYS